MLKGTSNKSSSLAVLNGALIRFNSSHTVPGTSILIRVILRKAEAILAISRLIHWHFCVLNLSKSQRQHCFGFRDVESLPLDWRVCFKGHRDTGNSLRQFAATSPVTLCLSVEEKSIEIKKVRAKSRLAKANRSSRMQK